jgi:ADP-heptose:LPS heptosyltransferase/glycosyltransferase involved in cell wall biosynthesis
MAHLSVIVITGDEQGALPALLASVREVADEVLVVDSGSTGKPIDVASSAGARVLQHPWEGPGAQRRWAVAQARNDWILSLDADERLAPDLAAAIRAELSRPDNELAAAYRIHFRHRAFGRPARFGAMWHDRRVRLFDRRRAGHDAAPGHGRIAVEGPVRDLSGRCDHLGYRDVADAREMMARFAEHAARWRYRNGARWRPWHVLRWPTGFLLRYMLWLGLLDGLTGLRLALLGARQDLDEALWLRRLDREIGGARGRSALASRLRSLGRAAVVMLASALLPRPRRPVPPLAAIRKVLVVRPDDRVGNQLLTTPLLRALEAGLPHAELHLLAPPRRAAVIPVRLAARVVPWDRRAAARAPWRLVTLLRTLRRERYDVVIEAAHWSGFSLTASLLSRLASAGAPVVGHARGDSPRFLSHPVVHDPANENEVQAKLELLRPLGVLPRGLEPETDLGLDPQFARAVRREAGAVEPFAVLNPGARMADRRWSPAAHAQVARGLMARGLAVVVVWGPGEETIARAVAAGSGASLAPPTRLTELAALLRGARLCVSNNSGPMHLSVAVGTPTVGVFLSGDAARWGHSLPGFAAADPRSDDDAGAVLDACDHLLRGTGAAAEGA